MKTLILAFLMIFFFSSPASAIYMDSIPVVCDNTKNVLTQLKEKLYQPVIVGEVETVQTTIFLNKNYDMVIAVTVNLNGRWTTCIFIGGDSHTQTFDLPKRSSEKEKDL